MDTLPPAHLRGVNAPGVEILWKDGVEDLDWARYSKNGDAITFKDEGDDDV